MKLLVNDGFRWAYPSTPPDKFGGPSAQQRPPTGLKANEKDIDISCTATLSITAITVARAAQDPASTVPNKPVHRPRPPALLPRICSDWNPGQNILSQVNGSHKELREAFECSHAPTQPRASAKSRLSSHHGYFLTQLRSGVKLQVPVDPSAGPNATVVIDEDDGSIYDVYLLPVDIAKNVNLFQRHQLVMRESRVGLHGTVETRSRLQSSNLMTVVGRFRRIFRNKTVPLRRLPNYATIDTKVHGEVKGIMELVLYGGSVCKINSRDSSFRAPMSCSVPGPFFRPLRGLRVSGNTSSLDTVNWKAILSVSSRNRSQMPFSSSSYHAIFLELQFLYCSWPWPEIGTLLTEVHSKTSLQMEVYRALTQPLYQAYGSLKHEFRRLTDPSTLEFRELKNYLEKLRNRAHYFNWELQEIYKIFIPPGANLTGTMFGNGIYLADVSSKSVGYCRHRWSEGEAVLLLCEADVGACRIWSHSSIYYGHGLVGVSCGLH
ncbi:hypothetical protein AJ80_03750 [Polytolypa hystricis UAMH7299]|uniref:NAD(+) ADP-ribosyltransferase n=1 Tax=Polytolypa hystricis (strain UAMH7299) TaxID=1447883 RepID=A0A2B7YFM3_POLH7|nr:hypothetical protein AJ80_03750 [Polytolypa hystricis UAMH7299]